MTYKVAYTYQVDGILWICFQITSYKSKHNELSREGTVTVVFTEDKIRQWCGTLSKINQ